MSIPQNLTEPSYDSVRPDAVPCYVRKDGTDERPKRAYSVGSKPLVTSSKPLNGSYIDMSGEPVATKDAEKSSSAPHLNDDDERKRELSDLFMELDFDRSNRDGGLGATTGFQERASSGASPHGPQTKSATSFGARDVAAQKSSVFSRNKSTAGRPRTSTVCQEMLRPRTSSFGPSNLRPRSSSGGNVMSRQLQDGGRQSSRDSFQSHGRRVASQKNAKPGRSDSYLSMNLGKRSIDRLAESGDSGYMDMKLAEKKTGDSDYLKMTAGATGTTAVVVSASGENASARTSERMMMRQRLETVKAGNGDDYLEMAPESPSQSKVPGTTAVVQPKVKVTRSLGETASSYMQMAPRGASSDRTVRTNLETKDVHSPQKNDSYMEMSLGPGRHGKHSSASSLPQGAGTNSRAHTTCERARGSVVPASSSDRDGVRRSDREQNVSPHEDVPPPPFQLLMIPSQNFLLRADHTPPTIPAQPSASGTVIRRVAANSSVSPAVATFALDSLPGQTSYATLNPESLMGRHSTTPPAEGRRTGSIGRVRGLGRSSHQHIYAQIDFETSEECQK